MWLAGLTGLRLLSLGLQEPACAECQPGSDSLGLSIQLIWRLRIMAFSGRSRLAMVSTTAHIGTSHQAPPLEAAIDTYRPLGLSVTNSESFTPSYLATHRRVPVPRLLVACGAGLSIQLILSLAGGSLTPSTHVHAAWLRHVYVPWPASWRSCQWPSTSSAHGSPWGRTPGPGRSV